MAQTNVSFEMNEKLRDQLAELCDELGMDIEDAFQLFARKMVNEQEIPFEVTEKELPVDERDEKVIRFVRWTVLVAAIAGSIALLIKLIKSITRH